MHTKGQLNQIHFNCVKEVDSTLSQTTVDSDTCLNINRGWLTLHVWLIGYISSMMATARRSGPAGRSQILDAPQSMSQSPTSADRKLLDKVFKRLEKLHKLSTDPRLGLKNSPPFLPELVSETATLLTEVWAPYRGSMMAVPRGDEGEYLRIHIRHMLDKTDRAVLLFKDGKEKMFEETSSYR